MTKLEQHDIKPYSASGNTNNPSQAIVLLHGRGARAENILEVIDQIDLPADTIVVAPQAPGNVWYPERFIVPRADNQPQLDMALERVRDVMQALKESYNIDREHIIIAGFSQGGCLAAEYLKTTPARYRAGVIWSGGLIGDDDEVQQDIGGDLDRTPIYIGCDAHDFHIPRERVEASAKYFAEHKAQVTQRIYQNLGHAIHPEGVKFLQKILGHKL